MGIYDYKSRMKKKEMIALTVSVENSLLSFCVLYVYIYFHQSISSPKEFVFFFVLFRWMINVVMHAYS